jgi:hypothetical protein
VSSPVKRDPGRDNLSFYNGAEFPYSTGEEFF